MSGRGGQRDALLRVPRSRAVEAVGDGAEALADEAHDAFVMGPAGNDFTGDLDPNFADAKVPLGHLLHLYILALHG